MSNAPGGGERVVLVHLQLKRAQLGSDVDEFQELARAAGAQVVGTLLCPLTTLQARYCIGSGKVEELKALVADSKAQLVLVNYSLTPTQERNLERFLECRVIDRTGLILDIFASRARSYEGKLQVELAQLRYHATRLVRGWTHLERQKGGIGLRGPGETQLEVDRRLLRGRIKQIEARLDKVRQQRAQSRQARQKAEVPTVTLVGYTNAGKSTLFNWLTHSEVFAADQVFATLDPTMRVITLPSIGRVILADTVGFIRELPHSLVEAFRATLEETQDADLLLHVIDCQESDRDARIEQVREVLGEIGALEVPSIEVYNKIDYVSQLEVQLQRDEAGVAQRVFVSAKEQLGANELKQALIERLGQEMIMGDLCLSNDKHKLRASLFELGSVIHESTNEQGESTLRIRLPKQKWDRLCVTTPELKQSWKPMAE